jgi:hypothetical protein
MKRHIGKYCTIHYLFFAVLLTLNSCATYNFSHPLPSDKPNMYEFPADWLGNWINTNSQQIIIGRNNAALIINDQETVVKGVWPKVAANGKPIFPPGGYLGMYHVNLDSLNRPVDTVANYYINADLLYEVTGKGRLEKGFHYTTQEDTFRINKIDTFWVDLGKNAFLRKLDTDFYVLNMLNQARGIENRWWQIILLEKSNRNNITQWDCTYSLTKDTSMFYENYGNYYFNSQWNAKEIIQFLKKGLFEKCDELKRVGN